ncbi:hypothetical protein AB0F43_25960 [Kribbella sp. NPDC023972]|uniref:hypothetical protein n=1 Tax=Kribbella sp. NPDC023972 TaxID=3154795 RepID=UPI0033E0A044
MVAGTKSILTKVASTTIAVIMPIPIIFANMIWPVALPGPLRYQVSFARSIVGVRLIPAFRGARDIEAR